MFGEYICSALDRKVREPRILVEANLFLAITLQPDLSIRAILQVASILKSKLKVEIERKFLLQRDIWGLVRDTNVFVGW